MSELTRKVATAWRSFLSSEEGMIGRQWILQQRPPLDDKHWQQAGGFEDYDRRIDQILDFERARRAKDDEEDNLKQ